MKKQENNEQPCAHKHWYADPSDSSIFRKICNCKSSTGGLGDKIIDWWTAGSKHSSVVKPLHKTPKETVTSAFEHLIKIDHFLKNLGMTGSVINKIDLKKFRVQDLKPPNGLIKDNVYSIEVKSDSKRLSNILHD